MSEKPDNALQGPEREDEKTQLNFSAPWEPHSLRYQQCISSTGRLSGRELQSIANARTDSHIKYIVEQEKTKRLAMTLAALLIALAVVVTVFAPEGREVLSYWIGGALVIFAAGTFGFKRLLAKFKHGSLVVDQDKNQISN